MIDGLVDAWIDGVVMSLAITVALPAVFKVTLKDRVPPAKLADAGSAAFASDDVMPAVSVMLVARFQFASTALTVTLNEAPAV